MSYEINKRRGCQSFSFFPFSPYSFQLNIFTFASRRLKWWATTISLSLRLLTNWQIKHVSTSSSKTRRKRYRFPQVKDLGWPVVVVVVYWFSVWFYTALQYVSKCPFSAAEQNKPEMAFRIQFSEWMLSPSLFLFLSLGSREKEEEEEKKESRNSFSRFLSR